MTLLAPLLLALAAIASPALASPDASPAPTPVSPAFALTVEGIDTKGHIHKRYAQCIATVDGLSTKGENQRPTLSWTAGPEGTRSYAIVVSDSDVPADLSIANQKQYLIADDMPRQTLYHWIQYNITADTREVFGGTRPPGFGKAAANTVSQGTDVYGYGGPCPPWNDALVHRYHFTVHALKVAKLPFSDDAPAADVVAAIEKNTLAKAERIGTFTLNPSLRKGL